MTKIIRVIKVFDGGYVAIGDRTLMLENVADVSNENPDDVQKLIDGGYFEEVKKE